MDSYKVTEKDKTSISLEGNSELAPISEKVGKYKEEEEKAKGHCLKLMC